MWPNIETFIEISTKKIRKKKIERNKNLKEETFFSPFFILRVYKYMKLTFRGIEQADFIYRQQRND